MIALIVKLLDIVEGLLEHFVAVNMHFTQDVDNQWAGYYFSNITPKGDRLIGSLSTIIDNVLIMIAQLSVQFPLPSSVPYISTAVGN